MEYFNFFYIGQNWMFLNNLFQSQFSPKAGKASTIITARTNFTCRAIFIKKARRIDSNKWKCWNCCKTRLVTKRFEQRLMGKRNEIAMADFFSFMTTTICAIIVGIRAIKQSKNHQIFWKIVIAFCIMTSTNQIFSER